MHCRLCHIYPGMLLYTSTMLQCVVSCLIRAVQFSKLGAALRCVLATRSLPLHLTEICW